MIGAWLLAMGLNGRGALHRYEIDAPELGDPRRAVRVYTPLDYAVEVLPRARAPVIYFDCGADDENVADNRALDRLLTSLGVPHTYVEYGGGHGWSYWRSHLAQSLIAVTAGMSDASPVERSMAPFESQATH